MKALKKAIVGIVILAVLLAVLLPFVVAPILNNVELSSFDSDTSGKGMPNSTTVKQTSYSDYGRLGTSDDIMYFSSVVIVSDTSAADLSEYYKGCLVVPLTSASFQPEGMKEPVNYSLLASVTDFTNYYVVYKFSPVPSDGILGMIRSWDKTV